MAGFQEEAVWNEIFNLETGMRRFFEVWKSF